MNDKKAVFVAFTAGILSLVFSNLTIGFLARSTIHHGVSRVEKIARA